MTRIHVPLGVRWGDQDAYGHVNNVAIMRLLEEARIRVFWQPDPRDAQALAADPGPLALLDASSGSQTQHLVSQHRVDYLVPMPYLRAPYDVQLWLGRLSGAAMEVCYEIHAPVGSDPDVVYVRASTTTVLYDIPSDRLRRMTEDERAAWEPYVEAPVNLRR